jgi:hypothetical protein
MRYTTIGSDPSSARSVSVLSLGAMRFGTTTDEATSFAILDLPPVVNRCVNLLLSLRIRRGKQQRRVMGQGTSGCPQHELACVGLGLHDELWWCEPEAGGVQGGLDTRRAANPGEGRGGWLTVPDTPQ